MTDIEQIVPVRERIGAEELAQRVDAQNPSRPFDDSVVERCAKFSRAIFGDRDARGYPELQALAFWMRKAELIRLREAFENFRGPTEPVPRGVVFHIPPSNVDTIFVYCWLFSALTGNINVIRLPERAGAAAQILCRLMAATANGSEFTSIVRYGRDPGITAALSRIADVRVIWGGDATVDTIRGIPIPAHSKELTFADRTSLSVLDAERYRGLAEAGQAKLAEKFFNDAFWFDQMACSSPRWIVWRGSQVSAAEAGACFLERLSAEVNRRGYVLADAVRLARFTFACRAILETPVSRCMARPELMVLDVNALDRLPPDHSGGGLFFQWRIERLTDLAPLLRKNHQTMSYFGLEGVELRELARILCGRAVDRMVPIGQALAFNRFWDGYDLLREFTRSVHIDSGASS